MITASSLIVLNGVRICCIGDLHDCPIPGHGITPLVKCSEVFFSPRGKGVANVNVATAACGAVLIQGVHPKFVCE